jgi:hypothetical protein
MVVLEFLTANSLIGILGTPDLILEPKRVSNHFTLSARRRPVKFLSLFPHPSLLATASSFLATHYCLPLLDSAQKAIDRATGMTTMKLMMIRLMSLCSIYASHLTNLSRYMDKIPKWDVKLV